MERCRALNRHGLPCGNRAEPGSLYCWVHRNRPHGGLPIVVLGGEMIAVRYLGRTSFFAFHQEFHPSVPVRLLPKEQAQSLVQQFPSLFRIES